MFIVSSPMTFGKINSNLIHLLLVLANENSRDWCAPSRAEDVGYCSVLRRGRAKENPTRTQNKFREFCIFRSKVCEPHTLVLLSISLFQKPRDSTRRRGRSRRRVRRSSRSHPLGRPMLFLGGDWFVGWKLR